MSALKWWGCVKCGWACPTYRGICGHQRKGTKCHGAEARRVDPKAVQS